MIARKAWPFRGTGLLASGRKVKMFPVQKARAATEKETSERAKVFENISTFERESSEWEIDSRFSAHSTWKWDAHIQSDLEFKTD
jgi:hypothetical protein